MIINRKLSVSFPSRPKLWPSNYAKTSKSNHPSTNLSHEFRVVVVLENRVYVYNFADLRLIDAIDTCNNPKGLCALNPDGKDTAILATPSSQKGYVRIAYYSPQNTNDVFKAHDTAIEAIVLSKNGDFLATASETGTIIRIFNTGQAVNGEQRSSTPYQEVRRGTTNANIHSLVFDNMDKPQFLACSSDRDTIHIFAVEHKDLKDPNQ